MGMKTMEEVRDIVNSLVYQLENIILLVKDFSLMINQPIGSKKSVNS